jgi:uncharacterized protein
MNPQVERPGVVFDCNVTIQAFANGAGPSGRCLAMLEHGRIDVFLSRAILRELRSVLSEPEVRARWPYLTDEQIEHFIQKLVFRAILLRRIRHLMDYPRATQDEPYLDAAWTAGADYLLSRDKDLLALVTDHSPIAKAFRRSCPKLRILNPVAFLLRMDPAASRN